MDYGFLFPFAFFKASARGLGVSFFSLSLLIHINHINNISYYRDVYLKSEHWKQLKHSKAKHSKKRCIVCYTRNNLDLHHLFYRTDLKNTELLDLKWLCRRCHEKAHELIRNGEIPMNPGRHSSHYVLMTKHRVRKALGISFGK